MAVIEQFHPDDRPAIAALCRRVFGRDAADTYLLRWDWAFRRNPATPSSGPLIWVAREGPAVVAHCAAMPVRLRVAEMEIDAAWGSDLMVAPERRRQGLGELLFRTWDASVGASLGLGFDEVTLRLFRKLRWPEVGPVPALVKPLTRRAFRRATWPTPLNRLVSAVTLPVVKSVSRMRPLSDEVRETRKLDDGLTRLWDRVGGKFDFAVRRDAPYLRWRYLRPPHVRYSVALLWREGQPEGYVVYRHVHEPRGRVTLIVDFLADPDDKRALPTLLRFVDREAKANDSDKIRAFCLNAGFRKAFKRSGYFAGRGALSLVARVNAVPVASDFYKRTDRWHVTAGDSDQDR